MPKNRRIKQREREKMKRWKQQEMDGPDRYSLYGFLDLTPYNASRVIRNYNTNPEDCIVVNKVLI